MSTASVQKQTKKKSTDRTKRSPIWDHYNLRNETMHCKYCSWKHEKHSTTSLFREHLKSKHHIILRNKKRTLDDYSVCSDDEMDDPDEELERKCDNIKPAKLAKIDSALLDFIIDNQQPASLVNSGTFRAFCSELMNTYVPPCRQTITYKMLPDRV